MTTAIESQYHFTAEVKSKETVLSMGETLAGVEPEDLVKYGLIPEFIGRLLDERLGIAIAGTHGKTTTTAMLAVILKAAGRNPGYLVGAAVADLDGNAAWGTGA